MSAQGQAAQGQGALPAKSILVGAGGFWRAVSPFLCVGGDRGQPGSRPPGSTECGEGAPAKGAGGARLRVPAWVR